MNLTRPPYEKPNTLPYGPYLTTPASNPRPAPTFPGPSLTPSLTPPNSGPKLPNLINPQPRPPRLRVLGEHNQVRVGTGVQRALDPAEREHGGGRGRDRLERLRDAGAGPLD